MRLPHDFSYNFRCKIDTPVEIYAMGAATRRKIRGKIRDPINRKVIPFDPFWRPPMEMRLTSFYRILEETVGWPDFLFSFA